MEDFKIGDKLKIVGEDHILNIGEIVTCTGEFDRDTGSIEVRRSNGEVGKWYSKKFVFAIPKIDYFTELRRLKKLLFESQDLKFDSAFIERLKVVIE